SSLLFLFIFWELVGLCSYLLIGFYFDKKFASDAAIKAFVTNRVGDFGFLFGLMMVFFFLGTLDLDEAAAVFGRQYAAGAGLFAEGFTVNLLGWELSGGWLATMMGVGLFCGAMGKSAQFPLHVWLPDAMAGPTPVSALIHAATMVAAGVYLVARVFRLLTPEAQFFVAVIGCITLTLTALIAVVQTDIKKVLAYSTLSQLGYMIFGLGVGAWIAALFHLMTHAFFKAMMFLGSGQVIEGCHHEQEITKMGGLRRKMPVTCWTFFVGVLAIAGTGIPWTSLGIGGFYSKDEILATALLRTDHWPPPAVEAGHHASAKPVDGDVRFRLVSGGQEDHGEQHGDTAGHDTARAGAVHVDQGALRAKADRLWSLPAWMFWLPIIIAYVTPFYMMRLWWLTFMGQPRDQLVYEHAHETKLMVVPLVVLTAGTFFSGWFLFRTLIADAAPVATQATLVVAVDGHAADPSHAAGLMMPHAVHSGLAPLVGFAFVIGFGLAWLIYRNGLGLARSLSRAPGVNLVHAALCNKLYFDHVYNAALVGGCKGLAVACRMIDTWLVDMVFNLSARITERISALSGRVLDAWGVDGVINGLASASLGLGDVVRRPQTGRIRNYVLLAAGAAAVVVLGLLVGDELYSAVVGWIGR
ncbi:MAG: proton-conducting transporter membrane subunit, partial [Phycisphaerae bacterium]